MPTACKRIENALQFIVRLGFNNDKLDWLPYSIIQPIREALRTCQLLPGIDGQQMHIYYLSGQIWNG